jgi:hypothetical protein
MKLVKKLILKNHKKPKNPDFWFLPQNVFEKDVLSVL